jgi:hypothetical protein
MTSVAYALERTLGGTTQVFVAPYEETHVQRIIALLNETPDDDPVRGALAWVERPHVEHAGRTTPLADAFLGFFLRRAMQPQALLAWAAAHGATQLVHEAVHTGQCDVRAVNCLPLRWAVVNNHVHTTHYLIECLQGEIDVDEHTIRAALMYDHHDIIEFLATGMEVPFPMPLPRTLAQHGGDKCAHRREIDEYVQRLCQ